MANTGSIVTRHVQAKTIVLIVYVIVTLPIVWDALPASGAVYVTKAAVRVLRAFVSRALVFAI